MRACVHVYACVHMCTHGRVLVVPARAVRARAMHARAIRASLCTRASVQVPRVHVYVCMRACNLIHNLPLWKNIENSRRI